MCGVKNMIESVFMIGGVLSVIMVLIGIILVKSTPKHKFLSYFPSLAILGVGILLLVVASAVERVVIMDVGLGGWGIACLFAAAISIVITSTLDAYGQQTA